MAITVRSIDADELAAWGRLGPADLVATATELQADGTSGPDDWLLAERDGSPIGRLGVMATDAGCEAGRTEHRIFGLWVGAGAAAERAAIAGSLARAAVRRLPPGLATLDASTNPELHDDLDLRRGLLRPIGGREFQEKVGVVWSDDDPEPPVPEGIRLVTADAFGRDAYARLMGACQVGTLDRNDRYYLGLCGEAAWGREMLGYMAPADVGSWLAALDASGAPVGYVAVGAFDEGATGTISHIGVLPAARGRGHVDRLLAVADRAARGRGFREMLSDVDVQNAPMLAAMERAGHRQGRRPWHVWHERLSVVTTRDGVPVTLRDLEHTDRAALMALCRAPGQERYLGSMASHFEDAAEDARAEPRMWGLHAGDEVVGFVMISDGILAERLAADADLVGPYYLWRLLVDARHQGRGYGHAAIDLVVDYLATRPGADILWTSCGRGDGSPQPFYERYGFVDTGSLLDDETLLRLDLTKETR